MSEGDNKGYVVRDRRRFDAEGTPREDEKGQADATPKGPQVAPRAPSAQASAPRPQAPQAARGGAPEEPPAARARASAPPKPPPPQARPAPSQARPDPGAPGGPQPASPSGARRAAAEGVDFSSLVLSLATNAMISLQGTSPDERIPGGRPNLGAAAQHIEILLMLEEKTRGNLTTEEQEMLQGVLYDLRMSYVERARAMGAL